MFWSVLNTHLIWNYEGNICFDLYTYAIILIFFLKKKDIFFSSFLHHLIFRLYLMKPFDIPYMDLAGPDCKYISQQS